jgi:membrane fusion protein (multidrug efflux system)
MTQIDMNVARLPVTGASKTMRRLAPPLLAVLLVLIFIGLATLRWDAWVGQSAAQTANDAYVMSHPT